jgi:hypothetical protein
MRVTIKSSCLKCHPKEPSRGNGKKPHILPYKPEAWLLKEKAFQAKAAITATPYDWIWTFNLKEDNIGFKRIIKDSSYWWKRSWGFLLCLFW